MKAMYDALGGQLTFEVEGNNIKEVFKELGMIAELFSHTYCDLCNQNNLRPSFRQAKGYSYYELKCMNKECGAAFAFGQSHNGDGLFPKWKDGWRRFEKKAVEKGLPV